MSGRPRIASALTDPRSDRHVGAVTAASAAMLFGSSYVATAFQLHGFTPLGGALWRSAIAAAALIAASAIGRWSGSRAGASRRPSRPDPLGRLVRLAAIGTVGGLVFIIGMNLAVSAVGATITSFVAGLYSIVAALFAPVVLGERLERRAVAGFAIALVGTALLAELAPTADTLAGLAAGGVAAVSFGLYLVLIRRWSRAVDAGPVAVSIANTGIASVGLIALIAVTDPSAALPRATPPDVVVATAWLVLVSAAGQLLVTAALRRVEAALVSSMLLLNPITATILAALLLHEEPSPGQLLGGVLVLVGMAAAADLPGLLRRRRAVLATGAASARR